MEYFCITVLSLSEFSLYVTVTCIITCVFYIALFTRVRGCYLRSKAILNVLNEREVLNDELSAAF